MKRMDRIEETLNKILDAIKSATAGLITVGAFTSFGVWLGNTVLTAISGLLVSVFIYIGMRWIKKSKWLKRLLPKETAYNKTGDDLPLT